MKKGLLLFLLILSLIFILSCVPPEENKSGESAANKVDNTIKNTALTLAPESKGLGNLCSEEAECNTFCHDNRGRCTEYCSNNPDNEVCQRIGYAQVQCEDGDMKFDFAPVNLNKVELMLPLGLMAGGHVTPVDHHYFQKFGNEKFDIEVYSPGKGIVKTIQHMPGAKEGEDYRIEIAHSCSISSIYIHIAILSDKLKSFAPPNNGYVGVNIPVEAGEIIGYFASNVDYSIADAKINLPGLLVPEHYVPETWKIHTANIYDYFNEPVKSRIIEKSLRTAEPMSGKIDYDIDGRLVGNWFLQGSNWYGGTTEKYGYWQGHLAIAYDYFDPERIVFSIAGYNKEDSRQFGVKGNSPDPAEVGIENGLVEYELVDYDYITPSGIPWDRKSLVKGLKTNSNEMARGVVLVQVLEDRKIKFETFPEKTASQVDGFTDQAKIYER